MLDILKKCKVDGNIVKLPDVQLDRKVYLQIKKSFELIGGKWKGGKTQGFIFQTNPTSLLKKLVSGEKVNLKKDFQFFETPSKLAKRLVSLAELKQTETVLEPSAGQGAIIREINKVYSGIPCCYELMDVNIEVLQKSDLRFNLIGSDFIRSTSGTFDKIIANPPFSKNQDIKHIKKMYNKLNVDGLLVSMASTHWENAKNSTERKFRDWLKDVDAEIIPIKAGAFKASGTMIASNIIIVRKENEIR